MKNPILALLLLAAAPVVAQDAITYQTPDTVLSQVFFAPSSPTIVPDRGYNVMLRLDRDGFLSVADLAQPEYRLGGVRFNPDTYSPSRQTCYSSACFIDIKTLRETPVQGLPEGARIWTAVWYPDDSRMLFYVKEADGIYLYAASVADGMLRRVTDRRVNAVAGDYVVDWIDDDTFIFPAVPESNVSEPQYSGVPTGPVVQQNLGKSSPARTYQDLLRNPHDEALFEYYFTSQLCIVGPDGTREVGKPAIYAFTLLSPDRHYLLTSVIHRPFSYTMPYSSFPKRYDVCDLQGNVVRAMADNPEVVTAMGYDTTSPYPRRFGWRSDRPATLTWFEALDGGNPKGKTLDNLDAVYQMPAPFTGRKELVIQTPMRLRDIEWCDSTFAMLEMGSRATRTNVMSVFHPGQQTSLREVYRWSQQDLYADPGQPVTIENENRWHVPYTNAAHTELLMCASGACADGEYPLIYRYNLQTQQKTILWQCQAPYYETVFSTRVVGKKLRYITTRQSLTEPENYYLNDVSIAATKPSAARGRRLTSDGDPYPSMQGVHKEQIRYKRADGIDLTATVYLPAGYDKERDGRLPVLMWAYPREYRSTQEASQVRGSKYRFTHIRTSSIVPWVLRGYCIMDAVEMPIVGDKETEPNDNYIDQLVMDAEAAAKVIYDMGVGDTTRMGVGGHSYGAFMTANLLAHTTLFRAGVARSGAYNRSLTPFGFQSETRTYWEAPEVYHSMSPFDYADQLHGALLLVHGELDNNTGTYPIQSERFYQALKGHKATTRYVVLPLESHGYSARENVAHLIWEQDRWFEHYVKRAGSDLTTDGPYIFTDDAHKGGVVVSVDSMGRLLRDTVNASLYGREFCVKSDDGRHQFRVALHDVQRPVWKYEQPHKVFVMSDPHGNFDCVYSLLLANGVISSDYHWAFGANHLVVNGDIFDRGVDVLPILWLVYKLEGEAEAAGGHVTFQLGNHEPLYMMNDNRYTEDKYKYLAKAMGMSCGELMGPNTILGQWLLTRNIITVIGRNLIVHAGLSREFYDWDVTIPQANELMSQGLYMRRAQRKEAGEGVYNMHSTYGPIWYRGLVLSADRYHPIASDTLNRLLQRYDADRIIVGHTVFDDITTFYEGRVIAVNVDNAKNREAGIGRAILIEDDKTWVVGDKGKIKELTHP